MIFKGRRGRKKADADAEKERMREDAVQRRREEEKSGTKLRRIVTYQVTGHGDDGELLKFVLYGENHVTFKDLVTGAEVKFPYSVLPRIAEAFRGLEIDSISLEPEDE